jgi:APA family basic amino acid/polyamine antiporter
MCGLGLVVLLVIVALIHHYTATEADWIIFIFSLVFAALHLLLFMKKLNTREKAVL